MARNIEAFKERIEIEVANARANAALVQTSKHVEKLTSGFKGILGSFSGEAKEAIEKVEGLSGSFGKLSSVVTGLGGSGIAGPLGMVAGGLASLGAAAAGAGMALFKLAESSAEMGNKIFEATEKTALSARTISAFAVAGKEVGLTVEDVASGLSKFTINMGLAADGSQKGSRLMTANFKKMGIDVKQGIEDPDKALATFIQRFAELPTSQDRVIAASEIFGKRFGSQLVAMFNEVGGNLDEFTKKLEDMGLIIDDETARESHEFEKLKRDVETQFAAMTRTIGFEVIPAFETMFVQVGAGLEANKANWKAWGQDIAMVMLSIETEVAGFANYFRNFDWTNIIPFYGEYKGGRDFYEGMKSGGQSLVDQYAALTGETATGSSLTEGKPLFRQRSPFETDSSRGAGRGRGAGASGRAQIDPMEKYRGILERLNQQLQFYGDKTEHARVAQDFMRAGIEKLTPDLKQQAQAYEKQAFVIADMMDVTKKIADVQAAAAAQQEKETSAMSGFLSRQRTDLDELLGVQHTAVEEANNFRVAYNRLGGVLSDVDDRLISLNATSIDFLKTYEKFSGPVEGPDQSKFADGWAANFNKKLQDEFKAQIKELGPPPPLKTKWKDFFKTGLVDAMGELATMFPQQQVSKKRGFFSKLLEVAGPLISLLPIPGAGLIGMGLSAASGFIGGSPGAGFSTIAAGLQPGHPLSNLFRSSSTGAGEHSHAMGLPYVPYDNYYARLHAGERVLTAAENANMGGANQSALMERFAALLERWESRPAEHVVQTGARGLINAMDKDAELIRLTGNRLRLA